MSDLPNISWFESDMKAEYRFIAVFDHETGESNVCTMVDDADPQIARDALREWAIIARRQHNEDEAA